MEHTDLPGFAIRPAVVADAPLIVAFIRKLAEYERLLGQVRITEADLNRYVFTERPSAEVILAESDGKVVGFALFFHNFSTFAGRPGLYLEDIFIDPGHRGKGYGKAMFQYLRRLAHDRGCGRMEWAVLDWNTPAIDFYRSLGARCMDDWRIFRLERGEL